MISFAFNLGKEMFNLNFSSLGRSLMRTLVRRQAEPRGPEYEVVPSNPRNPVRDWIQVIEDFFKGKMSDFT